MREAVENQDLRGESLGSWFGFCFFILTYNNSKIPLPMLSLKKSVVPGAAEMAQQL